MASLSVRLLGALEVTLDEEPVTRFESDKARALLAYLAIETERPQRRQKLAALLWPEWPERAARANLRRTLANVRQVIGDRTSSADGARPAGRGATRPFLNISRQTIQFNSDSDAWVDVTTFTDLLQTQAPPRQTVQQLEQAVELYGGDFLEGFSIGDSPAFEEWALVERERLRRLVIEALRRLADGYKQRGELGPALQHAWRQVELDPWRERAHRQLMRLLALSGQRGAALAQYETCRRLLAEELGVEPAEETTRLYERIRDGTFSRGAEEQRGRGAVPAGSMILPRFLEEEAPRVETPVFVARERELAELDRFLDLALAGRGQVVFVTGEAGSGKTALVQAFTRRAQNARPDLIVASGNGNAYTGTGDPYLPFRQILQRLTGDVEAQWAVGTVTTEQARHLWHALPHTVEALVGSGPDLIGTFVPGPPLVGRAAAAAPSGADWLTRLIQLVEHQSVSPAGPGPQQGALLEQCTHVLQALARHWPLVFVLDDLQWADAGSINLLFHLGRQLAGSRILIVGAYRPEEIALGRRGERHPLEPVVNELHRSFGDITVDLDRAAGRDFVEAFLESEPNRLDTAFGETLYRQTRGHPLFTIELLRGLQMRGDLLQDQDGHWVEGPALDWERLPARVEAVIAERLSRLNHPLRAALRVTSVEGETFTGEVVARVQRADEREMVTRLSGQLDRMHRLVRAESILRVGDRRLSRYRFRHILFQTYLYGTLDDVERAHLHEAVGNALEALYGDRAEDIAVQLARHFQEAGVLEKAVRYLYQAGSQAARLSANEEAIVHFTTGLELLQSLPETLERDRQELSLQLALAAPHQAARGYAAPETGSAYARAYELCQEIGETPELLPALWSLGSFYYARAECQKALKLGMQSLHLAQQMEDPLQVAMAHWGLGAALLQAGDLSSARQHLERVIAFYNPDEHHALAFQHGQDPGVSALAWASWTLWLLGYPDQALERSQEALAVASELDHPFTLGFALNIAGSLFHQLRRENRTAREQNEAMLQLSAEEGFPFFQLLGGIFQGWTQALAGQLEEACPELVERGKAQMRQGLDTLQAIGTGMNRPHLLALLVEACAVAGQVEPGLGAATEALAFVEHSGERYYEAELHRLKGQLLVMQGGEAEAEASFSRAIEVARGQSARSWELRATVSLCHLWQRQGRAEEARVHLAEIYGWFTEGFDTADLQEARALLEELP